MDTAFFSMERRIEHARLPNWTAACVPTDSVVGDERQAALDPVVEYFRCAAREPLFARPAALAGGAGYFTFDGHVCYGRTTDGRTSAEWDGPLPESAPGVHFEGGQVSLPFDLAEVLGNLRRERYPQQRRHFISRMASLRVVEELYYVVRPLLTVSVRKHLQRLRLLDWQSIAFPRWPVDTTVEELMRALLLHALKGQGVHRIPFIWFWPHGAHACAILTHDVETRTGQRLCGALMDLDDSYGIKSSFQVRPTIRDGAFDDLVDEIRRRGFELNLHDVDHDGRLFHERSEFLRRAAVLNEWARELGCRGFRSGSMYRNQEWYDAFEFSYDMSVPTVAHLEPQRGGCCTVMPYFVGDLLELPLTTTQDYSLLHILNERSTKLWERQIDAIIRQHGLISFIAHPDYLASQRDRAVYEGLLTHLSRIRHQRHVWMALPGEVNDWWRNRQRMRLVPDGMSFRIEGPQCERARLAYAEIEGDRLAYRVEPVRSAGRCH